MNQTKSIEQIKQSEATIYNAGYRASDIRPDQSLMTIIQSDCNHWLDAKLSRYPSGSKVLVVGCGGGTDAINLAKRGFQVVGTDLSQVRIQSARQRAREEGLTTIEFEVGDAEDLSNFADNSFDLVVCKSILHHLPNYPKAIAGYPRILKENGGVLVKEPGLLNPLAFVRRNFFPTGVHTPDEHPFVPHSFIGQFKGHYREVETGLFNITNLAVPIIEKLVGLTVAKALVTPFNLLDRLLTHLPFVRQLAWLITVHARK